MGKMWIKSCPRCHNGEVYMDHDQYGWYATCLQCGYSYDLPDITETGVGEPKNGEKVAVSVRKSRSINSHMGV